MSEIESAKSVTFLIPFVGFTLDTAAGPRRYTNLTRVTSDPAEIAALRASASVREASLVAPKPAKPKPEKKDAATSGAVNGPVVDAVDDAPKGKRGGKRGGKPVPEPEKKPDAPAVGVTSVSSKQDITTT